MPELTVISWRDIPAQVTAEAGGGAARVQLSERFQEAIDAAAMRGGLVGTDAYLAEWRREPGRAATTSRTRSPRRRGSSGLHRRRPRAAGARTGGAMTTSLRRMSGSHLADGRSSRAADLPACAEDDRSQAAASRAGGRSAIDGRPRMTETVLSSATKEVVIGFDRPFVIIGERINPTGRKKLAEEMAAGNFETVIADTIAQVEAGAQMLDVNAGIPLADEPAILRHTVELVQSITDVPLSIDSSIVEALEAGLSVYQGKALVNSVTGEDEQMERVLPLVAKHGAAVVAISNDETGHLRGSRRPLRGRAEDRLARRRPRHPAARTSSSTRW